MTFESNVLLWHLSLICYWCYLWHQCFKEQTTEVNYVEPSSIWPGGLPFIAKSTSSGCLWLDRTGSSTAANYNSERKLYILYIAICIYNIFSSQAKYCVLISWDPLQFWILVVAMSIESDVVFNAKLSEEETNEILCKWKCIKGSNHEKAPTETG